MLQFSMTLNDPNPDFKGTPLFDVDYFRNDVRKTLSVVTTDQTFKVICGL